jgi:hypothetical protein
MMSGVAKGLVGLSQRRDPVRPDHHVRVQIAEISAADVLDEGIPPDRQAVVDSPMDRLGDLDGRDGALPGVDEGSRSGAIGRNIAPVGAVLGVSGQEIVTHEEPESEPDSGVEQLRGWQVGLEPAGVVESRDTRPSSVVRQLVDVRVELAQVVVGR